MYTIVNAFNSREIISIGIIDCELTDLPKLLDIDVKDRLTNPLDEIVETTIIRNFGIVTAVDDFSSNGKLTYIPAQIDGNLTDYTVLPELLQTITSEIKRASNKRDELKGSNHITNVDA